MGTLFYGDNRFAIGIDDRSLAHLQLVILAKLRRDESFSFTWHKGVPVTLLNRRSGYTPRFL